MIKTWRVIVKSCNENSIRTLRAKIEKDIPSLDNFKGCQFLGVEDHIILWKSKEFGYFYTDLEYHRLFDSTFSYATSFSDGQAIIYYQNVPCVLDVRYLTITRIPEEIDYRNCRSNIVHGNIAAFNWENGKWGSYVFYDDTFSFDVPFLWDRLEFSRYPDFAYGGNNTSVDPQIFIDGIHCLTSQYGAIVSGNDLENYQQLQNIEQVYEHKYCNTSVYRFHKMYFSSEEKFKQMSSMNPIFYCQAFIPGTIYNPSFNFSQSLKNELSSPIDLRDSYFQEDLGSDYGYVRPSEIDSNLDHYQYVKGIYLKKN